MELDLWVPTVSPLVTPALLDAIASGAEELGIGRIWVGEHLVLFDDYDSVYPYAPDGKIPAPKGTGIMDPLATLAYLAARTTSVRLGTAMLLLPQRNPVYTAKEVATVDWLSGGRVDLGIGVGWLEEEFAAAGVDFARRGARTDEYLEVLMRLWRDDPASFSGEFYNLPPCSMDPKPIQHPHPPIHIGGESDAAMRRAARVGDGWHTFNRTPADLTSALARLEVICDELGRPVGELDITVCPYFEPLDLAALDGYAAAGADAVAALFFALSVDDVAPAFAALAPLAERARSLQ